MVHKPVNIVAGDSCAKPQASENNSGIERNGVVVAMAFVRTSRVWERRIVKERKETKEEKKERKKKKKNEETRTNQTNKRKQLTIFPQ